ncbi:hypothetical protein KHA80_02245 [Anaerobacillus sp. HL2]|nr:hypothetical protein KHA80_02245 [Anaerobacillus sp. HL2]
MKLVDELRRIQGSLQTHQDNSTNMQNQMTALEKVYPQIIDEFDHRDGEEIEVISETIVKAAYRILSAPTSNLQNKNFVINELISKCENEKQHLSKENVRTPFHKLYLVFY